MNFLRVYYFPGTGEIWNCLYDNEIAITPIEDTCQYIDIDFLAQSDLCENMRRNCTYADDNGLQKWYVQAGELYERDGWMKASI